MATAEKLKLQTNIPETIALEFERGLPVSGDYGDQVLFTLTDGRKWYAPPFVAAKVEAAGIPSHVPFTICKREIVEGNRRRIEYQIGDAMPGARAAAPVKSETATGATAAASVSLASKLNQQQPQHTAVPATVPSLVSDSAVALMKIAGCAAIDVILDVERYAQARGMVDFAFDPPSVQDLMTSLYIAMEKRAGRASYESRNERAA